MKPIAFLAVTVVFTFSLVSTVMAQSDGGQMSTIPMTALGTTTVDTPGSVSGTLDDSTTVSRPDFDLVSARRSSIRGAVPVSLAVPSVKGDRVAGPGAGVTGFAGLSHVDQRLADGGNQFSKEPPDQALAVGNNFVLEAVNTALAVYDQQGRLLAGPVSINKFFNLASEIIRGPKPRYGPFTSDPKAYYDRQTRRWFVTIVEIDVDPVTGDLARHSSVMVAVSHTDDPRHGYSIFSIDTTNDGTRGTPSHPGCPCFGDQPLIGADTNGFFITTNEFPIFVNGFNGAQIYAISKKALAAAVTPPPVTAFSNLPLAEGIAYSVQPAVSANLGDDDDDRAKKGGVEYFLSALDFNSTLDNRIAVWAATNTASLSSSRPNVKLTKVVIPSEVYGQPPKAEQKSGPTPLRDAINKLGGPQEPLEQLDNNDDRMNQVVFADGKLWAGVNTVVRQGTRIRAGIAFFSVKPNLNDGGLKAKVEQQGYISATGNDVLFPSIGVDNGGNATMVFTLAGPQFFPGAAISRIDEAEGDEDGGHTVRIIASGAAPEDGFTGYFAFGFNGVARWGDYSAATTDEHGNVWVATEFIPSGPRTVNANWGTFVARVQSSED